MTTTPPLPPRDEIILRLRALLRDALQVTDDDLEHPFVEIAQSSLAMVTAFRGVSDAFGVRLSLRRVFETCGNVEGLADYVLELLAAPPAPTTPGDARALSPAQRQLGFLAGLTADASLAWQETVTVYLEGRLSMPALERALGQLAARHEGLRARVDEGLERFTVEPEAGLSLAVADASGLPQAEQQLRVRAWLAADEEAPFIFDRASPLARARVLRLQDNLHIFSLTAHALIVDRPAMHRLIVDLGHFYGAEFGGAEPPTAEAPSYLAYHDELARRDAASDASRTYWRDRFADGVPQLELPADRTRPPVKTYRGARVVAPLDPRALEPLRNRDGGLTLTLHLLGALATFAARATGVADLVVGTFTRTGPPELVANATNAVPLRVQVDLEQPFSSLLGDLRGGLLDALDHADYPFASLVGALNPTRDRGRSPVFTIAFDREVLPESVAFGPVKVTPFVYPVRHARYDLSLTLVEGAGLCQLQLDYSTDLFEAATVRPWLDAVSHLLLASVDDAGSPAGALPWLAPSARTRMIEAWNQTDRPYPAGTLHGLVKAQAATTPDRVAVVHPARELSYAALDHAARLVATKLAAMGVGSEDRVAICMERTPEMIVAILGVLAAGAAYVPLDPAYPEARNAYILRDSAAKVLITGPDAPPFAAAAVACLVLDPELSALAEVRPGAPVADADDRLAYLIYTSGSTGEPKGVAIEHRSAVNFVHWALETFSVDDLAGTLASTSICFDLSVFEIFAPLACGGTVILAKSALELSELPAIDQVTLINTVPSAAQSLVQQPGALPSGLRVVNLAGEPLRRELVARLHAARPTARVFNLYGPSEGTTYSTFTEVLASDPREPTVGLPVANNRAYLLDARGEPVPAGVPGELWVAGIGVARGYFGRESLTRGRFTDDPFKPGERMYRTGDLALRRTDGKIVFLGRGDHQVKIRGYRIELGEIEAALASHPAIDDVVVVVREDAGGDKSLVAYLEAHASGDYRGHLRERLPGFMIPSMFVELPAFPRLPNGKVDRRALPAPGADRPAQADIVAPRTALERTLASLWSRLLGVSTIGVHDDFFALGGTSLLLTTLILGVQREAGVKLSLSTFFEAPTISQLAERLGPQLDASPSPSVRRRVGPEVKALFDALRADATLDASFTLSSPPPAPLSLRDGGRVFFTGATGFVGAHLLAELLARSSVHVECLIRCQTPEDGLARLTSALVGYDLWDPAIADRIRIVPGDLERPGLGLDDATRARLAEEVDAIFHVGALVNFIYPYRSLRQGNVEGTREVVRLAFERRTKPLHFVSSTAIWPMGRTGRFMEDSELDHDTRLNLGYDESKWTAERMLANARARGLPVSIYRPGEVSGHSRTGACVLDHFLFALVKGSIQLETFPEIKCHIDMTPVDYVAAAIAEIALQPSSIGKNYHVVHPRPCTADEFYALTKSRDYPFEVASFDGWQARLLADPNIADNALYPFTPLIEEFQEENLQLPVFDTSNTLAALAGTSVTCPPVYPDLLSTYYDYFVKVGFLHDPRKNPAP